MAKPDLTPVALRTGMFAYYDTTFNGHIPCKVVDIRPYGDPLRWEARIKLTTTVKAYKRGEYLWVPASDVAPRSCRYRRNYAYLVRCSWHVVYNGTRHEVFAPADA